MAETAFSEDGKYFSAISQDGRLKIWDTETNVLKQEYTPDLHLTSPPSCLQWITVTQSPAQKGKRRSVSEVEIQCVALGTTSGKILLYSVAQAKVETVLVDEKNAEIQHNAIVAMDWDRRYGLFSCNKAGFLCEWELQSGEVSNKYKIINESKNKQASIVSAVKIVPHSQNSPAKFIITASTQLKVWRLHNGDAEVMKCLGHNATAKAILQLTMLNNTCWLIEGSQTERLLSFWDVTITSDHTPIVNGEDTPNKKKRRKSSSSPPVVTTPTYNFVLEDAPKQVTADTVTEEEGTRLRLAAATRSGVVHYYGHILNGASTKPIKPSVTIQVATANGEPLPLHCCRLQATRDLVQIQLGYSMGVQMIFERITPDLRNKTQVLIRGEEKKRKKKKKQQEQQTTAGVPEPAAGAVTYVEPMGGAVRKRNKAGGTVEVPMEERLANLTVDLKSRSQTPVGHNLTRLLIQALHSSDQKLIQTVLQHNKDKVARQTVNALPADYVLQLLKQLTFMATRKTSQCATVCTWLSAILRCHSALLLASNAAGASGSARQDSLAHLLAVFTHRRSHLCQLLNLKGRLELTMAQRQRHDEDFEQPPLLDYHDTSSESDNEMEVEKAASDVDSEHSWRDAGEGEGDSEAGEGEDDGGESAASDDDQ